MGKDPESHYNLNKLHMIFTIVTLVVLAGLGGLFMKDYDRKWKDYQSAFRTQEIEKTRVKYDAETNALNDDQEYQTLLADLEKAKEEFNKNCADLGQLDEQINELNSESILTNQKFQTQKAKLDATRYKYEEYKAHHHGNSSDIEETFLNLKASVSTLEKKLENTKAELAQKKEMADKCGASLTDLELKERRASAKASLLKRKLDTIDPNEMSFINQIAQMIRNLPVLDLSTPTRRIEQIVVKEIYDDLIFTKVPRVDRCTTCHLGIANPQYENAAQPYKTHPNLELYLGNESAHPIEEFGCTVCHDGRGRGTSFNSTAHTPSSPEQQKEWEEKYDWEPIHHWENPMLPVKYTEAGCFKCHTGESNLEGAETLNLGLHIIEKAGCYNCHEIEKYTEWPKSGPSLIHLSSKLSKDWAYKWIADPQSFRHNTWMPSYFDLSNNDDPESIKRSNQEIHAIVEYLFAKSQPLEIAPTKLKGNKENGQELVASIGCFGCHQVEQEPETQATTQEILRRQYGPNLIGLGTKTSKSWLFQWLKDPNRYHPETRMPHLRLSDQEAMDIAEYLAQDKNSEFANSNIPAQDTKIIDEIALDFLTKSQTHDQAKAQLNKMSTEEKLAFSGEKLIGHYGCFSCHNIAGFEDRKPIGIELTEEGDKSIHKLDFGFVHIDHTKQAWFKQKVMDPRIFDKNKVKAPLDKLIMPDFHLTSQEADAVTTALLGFRNQSEVEKKIMPRTPENLIQEAGADLIKQMNCTACHIIDGEGGTIQEQTKEWLKEYRNTTDSETEKIYESFSPPNLYGIGKKLDPNWLFSFLHSPTTVRPWLKVRMPTYTFNTTHLNMIIKYFQNIDELKHLFVEKVDADLTKEEYEAAEKLFSLDYLGCAQCHVVGDQMPSGTQDTWAPNLSLAKTRLRPEWIIEWLKNPSEVVPGTKMPTFWDPQDFENSGPNDILDGDENKQIRVLRNYLLSITDKSATQQKPAAAPEPVSQNIQEEEPETEQISATFDLPLQVTAFRETATQ